MDALKANGSDTQSMMLRNKFYHLDTEANQIITSLTNKPGSEGITRYNEEQIMEFQNLCDMVIRELAKKYGVSEKRMKRYRSKLSRGKYPGITPYTTYDSLGGTPRTLVEPL